MVPTLALSLVLSKCHGTYNWNSNSLYHNLLGSTKVIASATKIITVVLNLDLRLGDFMATKGIEFHVYLSTATWHSASTKEGRSVEKQLLFSGQIMQLVSNFNLELAIASINCNVTIFFIYFCSHDSRYWTQDVPSEMKLKKRLYYLLFLKKVYCCINRPFIIWFFFRAWQAKYFILYNNNFLNLNK